MSNEPPPGDYAKLRALLEAALLEADNFDPFTAVHVATALARLDQIANRQPTQSKTL